MEQSFNRAFTLYKVRKNLSKFNNSTLSSRLFQRRCAIDSAGVCEELCPAGSQHAGGHVQVRTGSD